MKHIAKRSLSMLLALVMLCSLCVNALAADEVKVNSALSATELEKSASAQTVQVTVAPASAVTVSNYEVKLEVPKGWTITKIENDDPNATLTAADYNLANGQMAWTSADAEDKSVSKFVTYTVEIPANTAAGTYELKVTGVNAWKNYAQDAVLTKGQHDSTLTLTVKEKKAAIYFALTLLAFCTNGIHHVAPDYVVFVTIFLMLCPGIGVCSFKDVGPNFAWPAFIQLGFAMSLASCVNKTGGFQWLVDAMFTTNPAFSAMDPTLFITIWLAFVVVSHIIFAGMNAMEAVLVPVSMTMAAALGFDVYTMGLLTVMAIAPSANFLPFNSAPNLIYASTDRFSTAQQLKGAIVIAVLVIIGFVFLVNVWFPVIGIL